MFRVEQLPLGIEPSDLRGELIFPEFFVDIDLPLKERYGITKFRYCSYRQVPLRGLSRDLLVEPLDLRLGIGPAAQQLPALRIGESGVCARWRHKGFGIEC
jgi:hypothetical protein